MKFITDNEEEARQTVEKALKHRVPVFFALEEAYKAGKTLLTNTGGGCHLFWDDEELVRVSNCRYTYHFPTISIDEIIEEVRELKQQRVEELVRLMKRNKKSEVRDAFLEFENADLVGTISRDGSSNFICSDHAYEHLDIDELLDYAIVQWQAHAEDQKGKEWD